MINNFSLIQAGGEPVDLISKDKINPFIIS